MLRILLRIAHAIDQFTAWIGKFTAWLVLAMVLIGGWNVVGRYLGRLVGQNLASNGLLEAQWYLFDLVFLLGAAYTLQTNDHVRVDIFYKSLGDRQRAWVNLLGTCLFLLPFCGLVIFYSWESVLNSWQIWETSPDPGGLPRYPIKTMIIVGFVLLILQGIAEGIKNLAIALGHADTEVRD
ncbi:TRAP transporter small permease subunit [Synechocystis sp. LEGE 06083]|uniref:TRAP transporter small permease subunit n=1 Tax=Synechocystis sp. LEGE 06083 TaxID=915336 RepID=UPI00187FA41B|nr:TRAP transporter small permease subunit [Synechocystis sp. LEGE 06083]MBE9197283.1 TRAP transporter small permease subunit [Synechocystis sp. LEGE 06083]